MRYYAIIGAHTKEITGMCREDGISDVFSYDGRETRFKMVTKEQFDLYERDGPEPDLSDLPELDLWNQAVLSHFSDEELIAELERRKT